MFTKHRALSSALMVATAALLGACSDAPVEPASQNLRDADAAVVEIGDKHLPDLASCSIIRVPAGNKLASHAYAKGVQIYRWDGTAWVFVGPEAALYATPLMVGKIGTHYAGPSWESNGGSKVMGAVKERCTPDVNAIPWLLLGATPVTGHGIYAKTTFIQRLQTVGGLAPSAPGAMVGEMKRVPYTALYLFYKAK